MSNDYIGQFRGEEIDELLETVSTNVYTKAQIDSALSGKVNTAPGMGLSQESFTTEEKAKLAELENYDDTALKAQCKALAKAGVKNELSTENFSVYRGNGITVTRNSDGSLTINGELSLHLSHGGRGYSRTEIRGQDSDDHRNSTGIRAGQVHSPYLSVQRHKSP